MATTTTSSDEPMVQLATRVPRRLQQALKVHCVREEVAIQTFVITALRDRLAKNGGGPRRGRGRGDD